MSLFNFSDLAILWPFANEADRTVFVYKQHEGTAFPPNDARAMLALAGALGPIVMDDSSPDVYSVGTAPGVELAKMEAMLTRGRHAIYVGGSARNEATSEFIRKCEQVLGDCGDPRPRIATRLPRTAEEPRVLRVADAEFRATYHDDEHTRVREDYGVAVLTFSPLNTEYKALLVAGLHSPGTLSAARAISRPDLSRDVVRRIAANFHLPPHVLGTVEIVVRAEVDEDGEIKKARGREMIDVRSVLVNNVRLYPDPDVGSPRRAYPCFPTKLRSVPGRRPVLRVHRWPVGPSKFEEPADVDITFVEDGANAAFRSDDPTVTAKVAPHRKPTAEFFDYFAGRDLVVISPHSDDSVIGCGGLFYYLRNRDLWENEADRPNVHVFVMTASPRGVPLREFEAYCRAIGIDPPDAAEDPDRHAELRRQIRHNEARSEAFVLDTVAHWLDLRFDDPKSGRLLARRFGRLREEAESRGRRLTFLVPPFEDQHPTHRSARELVLEVLRKAEHLADVWAYESTWGFLTPTHINVILPLDKHAMFAKCQAIAMHQSQEARTRYSEVARTQARRNAEVVPEEALAFGEGPFGWDYVEVFHELTWRTVVYGVTR
jgi:LmbE family N-acetylglucosaminyl deacetylase